MKSLRLMVFFCSVLGLLGVFSYMFPAFAHQDDPHSPPSPIPLTSTASDVTADRSNLPTFVGHAAAHLARVTTFAEATELVDEFRKIGDWNDGSTYLVLLTGGGGVQAHMDNRELEDEDWSMLEDDRGNMVGQGFLNAPLLTGGFVDYYNDGDKRSYAIPFTDPFTMQPYILIGGFDLQPEVDKIPYEQLPGAETITPSITAEEVDTREELKMFVKAAIDFFGRALEDPEIDLVKTRKLFRAEDGPWRHVSTYIWIMDDEGNVIFNGGNRNIEQTNLLRGQNQTLVDIIERLIEASKKTEEDERFVNYDWDDPAIEGDEAPGGGAGGSSPKLGYVEPFPNPFNPSQIFIFGSGLYLGSETPEMETPETETPEMETPDDGGCAISGTRNTTQSSLLNLFLVMSVLFLAASFKRRPTLG
ncbi:MAG: cache domain-containing protein [Candidatus Dadabacteria bacterium]|nr:cache domain-containing protein [Candidatus Dadabacteria bacterium]